MTDELFEDMETRRGEDGECSLGRCGEALFSHVRGGPDSRIEFWDRPIVLRPP